MTSQNLKDVVWVSFLAALMIVFELLPSIYFPFLPHFLSMSFTVVPAIIITLAIGPKHATVAIIIALLGKIIIIGSRTSYIGELADFVIWTAAVWTIGIAYKKFKIKNDNKRTIVSLLSGVLGWTTAAVLGNILIFIPLYIHFLFGGSTEALVNWMRLLTPVTEDNFMFYYIMFATIPFSLIQTSIFFTIAFLLHKRIRSLYEDVWNEEDTDDFL